MYSYRSLRNSRLPIQAIAILTFITLTLAACDSMGPVDQEHASLVSESAAQGNGPASTNAVFKFADLSQVGSSVLRRSPDAISLNIQTSQLEVGYAYTVWWFVFDRPEFCSPLPEAPGIPSCGLDDVFGDAMVGGPNEMEITILGAADGSVIGSNGRAQYSGTLAKNDATTAILGDGIDNPMTAEVHYVIRSHGPAIPGYIESQITTFNGGCDPGEPNEGLCEDVQFSVHQAVN